MKRQGGFFVSRREVRKSELMRFVNKRSQGGTMNRGRRLQAVICMVLVAALGFLHGIATADYPPIVEGVNIFSSDVLLLNPAVEEGQNIAVQVTATTFGLAPNWRSTYVWISYTGDPNSWDVSECIDHDDHLGAGTYNETFTFPAPAIGMYPALVRVAGSSFNNCIALPPGLGERSFILDVRQRTELSIPIFSDWGMIILIAGAGFLAVSRFRKRTA
jgi:hypothetical protein